MKRKVSKTTIHTEYIDYKEGCIDIHILIKSENEEIYKKSRYEFIVQNRKTKEIYRDKLEVSKVVGEKLYAKIVLQCAAIEELLKKGVGDLYVYDKEIDKLYRIKGNSCVDELDLYKSKNLTKTIKMYNTKKENLSVVLKEQKSSVKLEAFDLDEQGNLHIEGYMDYTPLEIVKGQKGSVNLKISSNYMNKEVLVEVPLLERKDIAAKMQYTGLNYSSCGFKLNMNIVEFLGDEETDFNISFVRDNQSEIGITYLDNKNTVDTFIKTQKDKYLIEVKYGKRVYIKSNNLASYVELREIYINEKTIDIIIDKDSNIESQSVLNELFEMIVKDRVRGHEYNVPFEKNIEEKIVKLSIDISEWALSAAISTDIYDLYMKVGNRYITVASRLDDIKGKKNIIKLPRMVVVDSRDIRFGVEPYYTLSNTIALNIKKLIEIKNISSVDVAKGNIEIKGIMYIRRAFKVQEDKIYGEIEIPDENKGKIKLKYTSDVLLRKNAYVQYDYTLTIPKTEIKEYGLTPKEVIYRLNNSIVRCTVDGVDGRMEYQLNIKSESITITLEDKLKRNVVVKKMIDKISLPMYKVFNKILPIKNKMIIFQSYYGKSYACNPRAIYEELVDTNAGYKCVWILNDVTKKLPGNPIIVKPKSIKYYYYMARAKYFINNANFPDFYNKRAGAINIETWHGTPLKKLGKDVEEDSTAYKENTSEELFNRVKRWDKLIVPNKYTGDILSRAYEYKKEVIELGYPRNDVFYKENSKRIEAIKKHFNIDPDKKVIMYAPTWRENQKRGSSYKVPFDLEAFDSKFGEEYVLLLRLHYFDANRVCESDFVKSVINVSYYDDIADLYLITDVLITDYSSVMFDYANSQKPMLFYTYDIDEYKNNLRGLYFDFEENAPGPLIKTEAALFDIIANIEEESKKYSDKYERFREEFCALEDGNASSRVIEKVFSGSKR